MDLCSKKAGNFINLPTFNMFHIHVLKKCLNLYTKTKKYTCIKYVFHIINYQRVLIVFAIIRVAL